MSAFPGYETAGPAWRQPARFKDLEGAVRIRLRWPKRDAFNAPAQVSDDKLMEWRPVELLHVGTRKATVSVNGTPFVVRSLDILQILEKEETP